MLCLAGALPDRCLAWQTPCLTDSIILDKAFYGTPVSHAGRFSALFRSSHAALLVLVARLRRSLALHARLRYPPVPACGVLRFPPSPPASFSCLARPPASLSGFGCPPAAPSVRLFCCVALLALAASSRGVVAVCEASKYIDLENLAQNYGWGRNISNSDVKWRRIALVQQAKCQVKYTQPISHR